jgi:parvulin-like peptidyl-prolyl isomerase
MLPEIAEAIAGAKEGELIGPVQTELAYHILKVEKWFPAQMSQVREQVLESLFQAWLQKGSLEKLRDEAEK